MRIFHTVKCKNQQISTGLNEDITEREKKQVTRDMEHKFIK